MELPKKISVAGLHIDALSKSVLLEAILNRIKIKQKTFVVTPYSEFLFASLKSKQLRELFNKADFSIPDGIGIFWAHLFLSQPLKSKSIFWNIVIAWMQWVWTGASILLRPSLLYKDIPEKIVGADFVWDLVKMAADNNFSVYVLGGHGDTDKIVAKKFKAKFPNLKIAGTSNKKSDDPSIFSDVVKSGADMLLVGLGPIVQEKWIVQNLKDLPASFAIGLGGTFDYIAGVKTKPPQFIRDIGLEWLYRLVTQPSRLSRIFDAFWGMSLALVRLKVHSAKLMRISALAVVLNNENKILLCRRVPRAYGDGSDPNVILQDYWQFPQGGVERGETIIEGVRRELKEETGITSLDFIAEAKYRNFYLWNNATRKLLFPRYRPYKGQEQVTLFLRFTGTDSEIQMDNIEFTEYGWFKPEDVLRTLAKERQEHAGIVLAELAKIQV